MVIGTGTATSVTVNAGGMIGAGKATGTSAGTLTLTGNLTVQSGGIIRVRVIGRNKSTDALKVNGSVRLNNPVFNMYRSTGIWQAGDECHVFTGTGSVTLSGTPTFEPEIP